MEEVKGIILFTRRIDTGNEKKEDKKEVKAEVRVKVRLIEKIEKFEYAEYVEDTSAPEWMRLQRRIFTRWVNQKISKRGIIIKDVVRDFADGVVLINLMEVLK